MAGGKVVLGSGIIAWATGQGYRVDDIVSVGEQYYIAISDHTSSSTFNADYNSNRWRIYFPQDFAWRIDGVVDTGAGDTLPTTDGNYIFIVANSHSLGNDAGDILRRLSGVWYIQGHAKQGAIAFLKSTVYIYEGSSWNEQTFGGESGEVAIADNATNQSTGISFNTSSPTTNITVYIRRRNAGEDRVARMGLSVYYDGTNWKLHTHSDNIVEGNPSGVTFSLSGTNLLYSSDNMGGTYNTSYSRMTYFIERR